MHKPTRHDIFAALGFLLIVGLLIFSGFWVVKVYRNQPARVDFNRYPVRGIDISAHNGPVDFRRVKNAGYKFVWIKASEGETFRDTLFTRNHDRAVAAGLSAGAYHYFRFDCDGLLQAINLVQALEGREPELGVAIDVEEERNATGIPTPQIVTQLATMLDYLNLRGYPITLTPTKTAIMNTSRRNFPTIPSGYAHSPTTAPSTTPPSGPTGSSPTVPECPASKAMSMKT